MLSGSGAVEAGKMLEKTGLKEHLFQYIAREVLKAADAYLLRFLVKASILHDFTAAQAAAIFEEGNTQQLLEQCEQKGLFIQKVSGESSKSVKSQLF